MFVGPRTTHARRRDARAVAIRRCKQPAATRPRKPTRFELLRGLPHNLAPPLRPPEQINFTEAIAPSPLEPPIQQIDDLRRTGEEFFRGVCELFETASSAARRAPSLHERSVCLTHEDNCREDEQVVEELEVADLTWRGETGESNDDEVPECIGERAELDEPSTESQADVDAMAEAMRALFTSMESRVSQSRLSSELSGQSDANPIEQSAAPTVHGANTHCDEVDNECTIDDQMGASLTSTEALNGPHIRPAKSLGNTLRSDATAWGGHNYSEEDARAVRDAVGKTFLAPLTAELPEISTLAEVLTKASAKAARLALQRRCTRIGLLRKMGDADIRTVPESPCASRFSSVGSFGSALNTGSRAGSLRSSSCGKFSSFQAARDAARAAVHGESSTSARG